MEPVGGADGQPVMEVDWLAPFAVDVRVTLGVQGRGKGDPTYRVDEAGAIWRTSLTPDGPATIRVLPSAPATDSTPTSASTTAGFTRTSPTSTSTASGASIAASASSPASTRVR